MEKIKERAQEYAERHQLAEFELRGLGAAYGYQRIYNAEQTAYERGAIEQRAIDIKILPQLYVRWLMIDGIKPTWEEYSIKAMEE